MSVFAHYRKLHPRSVTPEKASKLWKLVAGHLKRGHTVANLCRAIDGYHQSPFHMGKNDRNEKYLGLDLIFRDETRVLRGIEYADNPPAPTANGAGNGPLYRRLG